MLNFQVIEPFGVKIAGVETEIKAGTIISLPEVKAIPLIEAGRIKPAERAAYRIYSEILQAHLWVVETDSDMHSLRAEGVSEVIYTGDEIRKLRTSGMDREGLKAVNSVKLIFHEGVIKGGQ